MPSSADPPLVPWLCLYIGANRGQGIAALGLVTSGPKIVSFEPNPPYACHDRRRRFAAGVGGQNTFFMTDDKAGIMSGFIDQAFCQPGWPVAPQAEGGLMTRGDQPSSAAFPPEGACAGPDGLPPVQRPAYA